MDIEGVVGGVDAGALEGLLNFLLAQDIQGVADILARSDGGIWNVLRMTVAADY